MTKRKPTVSDPPPLSAPSGRLQVDQLLETIPSGLFVVDRQQNIVLWNRAAEELTGFSAVEMIGRHCSALKGVPCGKECGLYDEAVSKPITGAACRITRRDGREIIIQKNVDQLRDLHGQVVGGIESFIDITRRVELKRRMSRQSRELQTAVAARTAELESERERLVRVLDAMADYAYICAPDFVIRFINRPMQQIFGDLTGQTCYRAFYGLSAPCSDCSFPPTLASGIFRQERTLAQTDRIYEIVHTPLDDSELGTMKLAVFRDITERKRAEEKLRLANEELDGFVRTVSHDMRSLLTPIIGYASFLCEEMRESLAPAVREVLTEIERQGHRMHGHLEDLLQLARVGALSPPEAPVDTGRVVAEVVVDFTEQAARARTVVEVAPLPPVRVPQALLIELFTNLISNALRYAAEHGPIEVDGELRGDEVLFRVRDHGPGVPEQERARVFDLFYRGEQVRAEASGTGIGLAIVQRICRRLGGRAWVEETPGGGATFCVAFPRDPYPRQQESR